MQRRKFRNVLGVCRLIADTKYKNKLIRKIQFKRATKKKIIFVSCHIWHQLQGIFSRKSKSLNRFLYAIDRTFSHNITETEMNFGYKNIYFIANLYK